jgi:tetratricopeptide (TPR) repeat protein
MDPTGRALLEEELGRDLRPSETSGIFVRRVVGRIREQPWTTLKIYLQKAYRFWNGYELPQLASYDSYRDQLLSLRLHWVPFTVISAFGLVGLFLLRGRSLSLVALPAAAYFLSILPFFPTDRYRLPMVPLLCIAAAEAVRRVVGTIWATLAKKEPVDRRRRLGVAALVAAPAILVPLLLPRWTSLDPQQLRWQVLVHDAYRAARLGDASHAASLAKAAIGVLPGYSVSYMHAGFVAEISGDPSSAAAAFEEANNHEPRDRLYPYLAGKQYEALGQWSRADSSFQRSIAMDTTWSRPWFARGMLARRQGQISTAIAFLRRAVTVNPWAANYQNNLAGLLAEAGDMREAMAILLRVTTAHPRYTKGWINLAQIALAAGDRARCSAALERARKQCRPTPEESRVLNQLESSCSL